MIPHWQEQKGKRLQYLLAESVPVVFSIVMMHVNPESVSAAIRSAPAFARLGLSMRDATMRDRAADALAVAIVEDLERPGRITTGTR